MPKITKKRVIVVVVILLILGWIGFSRIQAANTQKSQIKTATAEKQQLREIVTSSGKTKALKQVDLHFQAGGRLSWVGVAEGDMVETYQTIASLDKTQLQKDLEKTLYDYSKERNDFEEDKNITYKDKVVTDTMKRILEKNQWDLNKAVLDVEMDTITLAWSSLVSPISGVVTHIDTPIAGVNVTVANIFTIMDPTSLVFSANIDESEIGKVVVGQKTEVSLDAYPDRTFAGIVTKIAYASEVTSSGATVFPVTITFTEPNILLTGLNGDVTIIVKEINETTVIPSDGLREKDDIKYVIKKTGATYQKITVKIGSSGDEKLEILEGVSPGDELVVEGFQHLPKDLQ